MRPSAAKVSFTTRTAAAGAIRTRDTGKPTPGIAIASGDSVVRHDFEIVRVSADPEVCDTLQRFFFANAVGNQNGGTVVA